MNQCKSLAAGWIEEDATYALLRSLQPAGIIPGTSMSAGAYTSPLFSST